MFPTAWRTTENKMNYLREKFPLKASTLKSILHANTLFKIAIRERNCQRKERRDKQRSLPPSSLALFNQLKPQRTLWKLSPFRLVAVLFQVTEHRQQRELPSSVCSQGCRCCILHGTEGRSSFLWCRGPHEPIFSPSSPTCRQSSASWPHEALL